jgi:hypothetical protein
MLSHSISAILLEKTVKSTYPSLKPEDGCRAHKGQLLDPFLKQVDPVETLIYRRRLNVAVVLDRLRHVTLG